MTTGRWRAALAVLAVVAGALAALAHLVLFPDYSLNRDDSVYVAMARLMESGTVTLPLDQMAFRPWASGVVGDRIVLKYTPPWPAVIAAADLVTGAPWVAMVVVAAATAVLVALLTEEVVRDRVTAVVAGAMLALSPMFVVQSGTFLPYVFQLTLGLAAAYLLLSGTRLRSAARLVLAGAVAGVAVFARPFDAVLTIGPFAVLVLGQRWRARGDDGYPWWGVATRVAAGAAPVLALMLAYDTVVMGSPLRLPFTVTGPLDTFGFGDRGVFPDSTIPFTPRDGLVGVATNLRGTPAWVFGGVVLIALAVVGLVRTRGPARWAVAAVGLVVPLAYLPFWGPYVIGTQWPGLALFGPFYYFPVLVPLVVLGAAGLVGLWRGRPRPARWLAVASAVAMVALTALAVPAPVRGNLAVRDDLMAVERFVAGQHLDDAVLLLPRRGNLGFLNTTPFLANDPALSQPVLYAEERGGADLQLVDRFPGRALYRLSEDLAPGENTGGPLTMDRLRVDEGPTVGLRLRVTNPTDDPVVVAYLSDGERSWTRALDDASTRGRSYDVTWTVAASGTPAAGDAAADVVTVAGAGVLAAGVEVRPGSGDASGPRWERRLAVDLVPTTGRVRVLRPGEGWARDGAAGAVWQSAGSGNPVVDLP